MINIYLLFFNRFIGVEAINEASKCFLFRNPPRKPSQEGFSYGEKKCFTRKKKSGLNFLSNGFYDAKCHVLFLDLDL